jgi:hypothetical protein
MKLRVLTSVAAAAVLAAGLSACQKKADESANTGNVADSAVVETTNTTTTTTTDMGNAAMGNEAAPVDGNAAMGNAAGNM